MHLNTRDDITPHKTAPREIPLPVKCNFIGEVQDLQQQGTLKKVTEPTEWVSALIVTKPSARPLNTALKCSEYSISTPDHLLLLILSLPFGTSHEVKKAPC